MMDSAKIVMFEISDILFDLKRITEKQTKGIIDTEMQWNNMFKKKLYHEEYLSSIILFCFSNYFS